MVARIGDAQPGRIKVDPGRVTEGSPGVEDPYQSRT